MTMSTAKMDRYQAIERSMTNVTPDAPTIEAIESVRALAKSLAFGILHDSKASREQSLALIHLEDCVMWAVKGLVLNGVDSNE